MKRFLGLCLLGLAACGPTMGDVLFELEPRFDAIRADFGTIARQLPPPGRAPREPAAIELPVAPEWQEDGLSNTEILMESELADPDSDPPFDLRLSGDLLLGIRWTGPRSPMADEARESTAGDSFREELEHALETRYLVVNRVLEHDPPEAVNGEQFRHGSIALEAILVDLPAKKVLGGFRYRAATSDRVDFVYREGTDDPKDRLQAWAESNLYENARKELVRGLAAMTGGRFSLE